MGTQTTPETDATGVGEPGAGDETDVPAGRPADAEPERELGVDEFDPVGTLVLTAIYLSIVVLLWLFVYFVEFLGNDLTVVGTIAG